MRFNTYVAPFEVKLAGDSPAGEFEGYASVFGVQDSHGDVIRPGAFADTLVERKAAGRSLPMHIMHGVFGGDGLPVGVWKSVAEDSKGLYVQGKISGASNTDGGKLLTERVRDGALSGLSIGYRVKPNGATYGKSAGEPKRTLSALHLNEISLVSDPSNPQSTVLSVKSAFDGADPDAAADSVAAAIRLHDKTMGDTYSSSTPKDKALLMDHLRSAHAALTGSRSPDGLEGWTKSISRADFVAGLRTAFGVSDDDAREIADRAFEGKQAPASNDPSPLIGLGSLLSGFSMPKFG
ncbi:HK97 family phage prohead protease [Lichenihabitans psoromatis]|uniref:HK97 family phage prohead protease n=1 Tax=Lichenihabitans psoromatis TaxID=2528642 RepID=UPI0010385661|nr:HK97 family phage prohead protease [Lichenihabitans psoromatis]